MAAPSVTLNDGYSIPNVQRFKIPPAETERAAGATPRRRLPAYRHCGDIQQRTRNQPRVADFRRISRPTLTPSSRCGTPTGAEHPQILIGVAAVAGDGSGRTSTEVLIRWHIQLGNIVIPSW
jgi:hypothetical protein